MNKMQSVNLKNYKLAQLLAIAALPLGIAAIMPAAPAGAVAITQGQLAFSDGTGDFYNNSIGTAGNSFVVNFNTLSPPVALVSSATGTGANSFAAFFPTNTTYGITPSSGTFSYVSGNITSNVYQLTGSPLDFAFTNGVTIRVGVGSTFNGAFNANNDRTFNLATSVGSGIINGADTVALPPTFGFQFQDGATTGGGTYGVITSQQVPEPFSIIGTIVGGTAAFRMRKKLGANKK